MVKEFGNILIKPERDAMLAMVQKKGLNHGETPDVSLTTQELSDLVKLDWMNDLGIIHKKEKMREFEKGKITLSGPSDLVAEFKED